jgi:hypothetical protein
MAIDQARKIRETVSAGADPGMETSEQGDI